MSKDFSKYKLSVVPSPFDGRNYQYVRILGDRPLAFPQILDYRDKMFDVRDQGHQGSCAAMAGAAIKDWQEIVDVNIDEYMSPQFIYNNRKDPTKEGMYILDLMSILKKKGTCKESTFSYGNLSTPGQDAYNEALNYVIDSYAEVRTVDALKQALYENGPCVIAVPVYNYTGRMWYQRPGDSYLGGHAMTVVGYNNGGFIIRNSWGDDWNDKGYTIFPYTDWGCQWEVWTSIDSQSFPVPPTPTPKSWWDKYKWYVMGAGIATAALVTFLLVKGLT